MGRQAITTLFMALAIAAPALALNCSECAISRVLASGTVGATVNYVRRVPVNGSFTGSPNDTFGPGTYGGLPSLCAVSVNVPSSANTSFNFGLFLPEEWDGRIMTTGNGGFGGGINWVSSSLDINTLSFS